MTTRIYVDRQAIAHNAKRGPLPPPIVVDAGGEISAAHHVAIYGPDGTLVAEVVYRPRDGRLPNGTSVWVELADTATIRSWERD